MQYAVYLHKELLLEGPLVVVADHQGPDLVMVLRVNPEQAAAFWSEAPLVEAGHVEVNSEVVDSKLGLELKVLSYYQHLILNSEVSTKIVLGQARPVKYFGCST